MIAVDCISFDTTASHDVIQSVRQFVRRLQPDDYVGLSAYPNGAGHRPDDGPCRGPAGARHGGRAARRSGPQPVPPPAERDHRRQPRPLRGRRRDARRGRRHGNAAAIPDPNCRYQLVAEVTNTALYYEGQATASLGMLRTIVTQMQRYPGRKTLLLVSGGMIASDTPGGRPDLGGLGIQVGKEAAAANTAIYTLFIDSTLHDRFGAETRIGDRTSTTAAATARCWRVGSSSSPAPPAARCSPSRSATPSPRSRGSRPSCRPTTCSASSRRTKTATAARTKSR